MNKGQSKGWMGKTAIGWAHFGDCNVCIVDWSRMANFQYAITALKHTRMVADFVSNFMRFLSNHGMLIEQVSIAGHSLGAQIAGFVGAKWMGKIAAIYGSVSKRNLTHFDQFNSSSNSCFSVLIL